jgi:preprotein translocase subunit SecG
LNDRRQHRPTPVDGRLLLFAGSRDPPPATARCKPLNPPVPGRSALAVIVIFLVLMHSGKDSGLSGAFGVGSGQGPLGGGSMVERNLNRWTVFFAVLFVLNAIVLLKRPWA